MIPIIKEWKIYNRYCNNKSRKFSLFFVKKKAFQIFNNESKQDRYSSKLLLNRVFNKSFVNSLPQNSFSLTFKTFPYYGHLTFCSDFFYSVKKNYFSFYYSLPLLSLICIHCGINTNRSLRCF